MSTGGATTNTAHEGRSPERRSAPRSRVVMPVEIALPGAQPGEDGVAASADVCDLSLSGICCVSSTPITLMTQVGLLLVLPEAQTAIDCRGAVVRSKKLDDNADGKARYETAIFFTSMAEPDRIELQEFLQTVR